MQLEKVAIRSVENKDTGEGGVHFAVFIRESDGSRLVQRISSAEHFNMKQRSGAGSNPSKPGYRFLTAYATYEFDTEDGELAEGQYAEDGDICICRLIGSERGDLFSIKKVDMPEGKVPKREIERINRDFNKKFLVQ